jgi:hypothetical protein
MKRVHAIRTAHLNVLMSIFTLTLGAPHAIPQNVGQEAPVSFKCVALNQTVMERMKRGKIADAERILSMGLEEVSDRSQRVCVGLVLHNMAVFEAVSGQLAEGEQFAARSSKILSEVFPHDNPVLLRPLQVLAATWFEQGETGKAREAFNRMRLVRLNGPEERALVHGMAAALLHTEGRRREAESEYLAATAAWEQAGRGNTPDASALLIALGSLYIEERRLDDAGRALGQASLALAAALDTLPMDRIKLLTVQATLCARQRQWGEAEQDLRDVLSIADGGTPVNPRVLQRILTDYARMLRKNRHGREARSVEARASAIPVNWRIDGVVDVADLFTNTMRPNK